MAAEYGRGCNGMDGLFKNMEWRGIPRSAIGIGREL
jgi:hypothetical protein